MELVKQKEKQKHKLGILWLSVSPHIRSGYGQVTKNIVFRLHDRGWPVIIVAYYGLHDGGMLKLGGIPVLPIYNYERDYGKRSVPYYMQAFNMDLPILFSDFWRFDWFPKLENSTFYGPLDHSEYGLQHQKTLKRFSEFITISKFGESEAKKYGRMTRMIPHGVDTQVFKPLNRAECRNHFNFRDDKFIIGIVAANNDQEPRKGWDKMFLGFKTFLENYPELRKKVFIFAYTDPQKLKGFDLPGLAQSIGIEKDVFFPDRMVNLVGLPEIEMAMLYNSFDILMNCCHDKETKVLMEKGIKTVEEVNVGDRIWALNNKNELVLSKVKNIYKSYYKGNMIHFKNKQFDLLVTPNHRIYYSTPKQNKLKIRKAKEFLNKTRYFLPVTGGWKGIDKEFIDKTELVSLKLKTSSKKLPHKIHLDSLLSIIGWYISEGSLSKRKGCYSTNLVRISNYDLEKKKEIASLLKKLSLKPILDHGGVVCHSIELAHILSKCGTSSKKKRIPKWCLKFSKNHLFNLYNSLINGDGSRKGHYSAQFYTSSKQLRDDVIILALKLGFSPHFWKRKIQERRIRNKVLKPKQDWCISIREKYNKGTLHKEDRYEEYYEGIIWCLETEHGNFFTERNGLVVMSGNSRREGFGLPILEAQSCGVPVIGTNFSSMPELIKGHGWLVRSKDWMYTPLNGKCAVPDQDDIAKKLEKAYFNKEIRIKYGKLSRKFAMKYNWDRLIRELWEPFLEEKERELGEEGEEPKTLEVKLPKDWMKAEHF